MKKSLTFLFVLLVLAIGAQDMAAKKKIDPELRKKIIDAHLTSNSNGRKFIVAATPNDNPQAFRESLEFYITSSYETTITISPPGAGGTGGIKRNIKPLEVEILSTETGGADWAWEVWEDEDVVDKGMIITAEHPISVYFLNSKGASSDGYMAIPVAGWGTDYIHCGYYDFGEWEDWGSGFIVLGSEDDTEVRIHLKGRGAGYDETVRGKKIGDVFTININEGQVYQIRGAGQTQAAFDLTGSRIVSDKPIGLLSFHNRTVVPKSNSSSRDHLVEMLPPVTAWGNQYTSIALNRKHDMGDLFRIVAAEDDTDVDVVWYDFETRQVIGSRDLNFEKGGEFHDIIETDHRWPHDSPSIRGTSVFKANKPILVMQYSYSVTWDGDSNYDPFMFLVTSVEQYIPGTVFQVPAQQAFRKNYFNIIAVGDTTDPERKGLRSIKIGRPGQYEYIADMQPNFTYNQIPNSNLFWARLEVPIGPRHVYSEGGLTKFGGYVYGYKSVDSYGWPAAMAFYNLEETDTLEPEIFIEGECGVYDVRITELRDGNEGDDPFQRDEGVINPPTVLDDYSYNFMPLDLDPDMFEPANHDFTFQMEVEDKYADAFVIFSVSDIRGNVNVDSIRYEADSLLLDPEVVDFGDQRLLTTEYLDVILKSASDSLISIESIELQSGDYFFIESGGTPPSFELSPRGEHTIRIGYYPERNSFDPEDLDIDSLIIETECLEWKWEIKGRGIAPEIRVADFDAGVNEVNSTTCVNEIGDGRGKGLRIDNPGSEPLIITGYKIENEDPMEPFTVSDPFTVYNWENNNVIDDDGFPFTVGPQSSVYLRDICYSPTDIGEHMIEVTFESNASSGDSVSTWEGIAVTPGPVIEGFDFERRRVGSETVEEAAVKLYNTGTSALRLRGFDIPQNNTFEVVEYRKNGTVTTLPGDNTTLPSVVIEPETDEITIVIRYTPDSEFEHEIRVSPVFQVGEYDISAVVEGFGYLPKIEVSDYEFVDPILVGTKHPETGEVNITNPSQTAKLEIRDIYKDPASPHPDEFTILNMPDLTDPYYIDEGATLTLEIEFTPESAVPTDRTADIIVVSDATEGNEPVADVLTPGNILGHAFDQGAYSGSRYFGDLMRCETVIDSIVVGNESQDGDMTIAEIRMLGDAAVFNLIEQPATVPAGGEAHVVYEFIPGNAPKPADLGVYNFSAPLEIDVQFQSGKDTTLVSSVLTADMHLQQVDFSLRDLTQVQPLPQPGEKTIGKYSFPVYAQSTNWNQADVKYLELEIVYDSRWMRYDGTVSKGPDMQGDWDISAVEEDL
ncbi:MAG: IgGFc-binding protein, partial [Candidatus Kapaibacterium sp.]